ncbi:MAG: substrate-binding domain-containing protein [Nitrospirae bacterium]|nr:substrate-binding domain-containing protein [Nitrospirota bacterium]
MNAFSALILMLFIFSSCSSDKHEPAQETGEKTPAAVIKIIIGGSESVIPIIKILAKSFEAEKRGVRIDFASPGHTGAAVKGVNNGLITLGLLSRELNTEERSLGLAEFWFAKDILVFSTHPSVNLKGLSSDDIRAIYYGESTNWKEMGGPDKSIIVLNRPEGSSASVLLFETSFFSKERKFTDKAVTMSTPNDMNVGMLSSPYSIGFTSMASIMKNGLDLNVLSVDGVFPSPENVKTGKYLLARPQGFVVKEAPAGAVKEFIDFIFSSKGRAILADNGYIPLDNK